MIEVQEQQNQLTPYIDQFERFEQDSELSPAHFLPIRKAAIARFAELGFPTNRDEDWRFTNVAPIANMVTSPASQRTAEVSPSDVSPFLYPELDGPLLVFVNGRYCASLSHTQSMPDGVRVLNLAEAISAGDPVIEEHLARHACYQDRAFAALNTALFEDGVVVHVSKGATPDKTIQVLFITSPESVATVAYPRVLVVADESSQVSIVESYASVGPGDYFVNSVTEVVAGANATVDICRVEHEGDNGFHIGSLHLHQYRSSRVQYHLMSLGGRLISHDVYALLDGEGIDCSLNGFYVVEGKQQVDNHLWVDHAKPHCDSREFFKGVLADQGRGVFCGRIIVREGAQKTDAKQTNQSLLLSDRAQIESNPQLEIFADDVKCTHGATIGQISEESMFYLQSRGLSKAAARNMLVYAFAAEVMATLKILPVKTKLEAELFSRLPRLETTSA